MNKEELQARVNLLRLDEAGSRGYAAGSFVTGIAFGGTAVLAEAASDPIVAAGLALGSVASFFYSIVKHQSAHSARQQATTYEVAQHIADQIGQPNTSAS